MSDARASDPGSDPGPDPVDRTGVDLDVPPGAEVFACGRCGERFPRERPRDLHRGLAHAADLTEAERDAYAEASAEEGAELRRFRIVSLGLLVLLYFGFLMLYAAVPGGDAAASVVPLVASAAPPRRSSGRRPSGG